MKNSWKQSFKTVASRWRENFDPQHIVELIVDIVQMIVMFVFAKYVIGLNHDNAVLFAWFVFIAERLIKSNQNPNKQ